MDEHVIDVAIDLGEIALDATLDDGLLKDVPVLGTIVNVAKAAASIRDRILLQKIRAFLQPCVALEAESKVQFRERMSSDREFRAKVQEILALFLDRCDDLKKAEILGAIFMGLVRGTVDLDEFYRIVFCVDRAFVPDLARLHRYPKVGTAGYRARNQEPIALSNLVKETNSFEYHSTELGRKLLQLLKDANVEF